MQVSELNRCIISFCIGWQVPIIPVSRYFAVNQKDCGIANRSAYVNCVRILGSQLHCTQELGFAN